VEVSGTSADLRFLQALCDKLSAAGFAYSVGHGTLLGLVREGSLIKRDKDVDLCFLHDEVNILELVRLLENSGFELVYPESKTLPRLPVPGSSRFVDINLYVPAFRQGDTEAYVATYFATHNRSVPSVLLRKMAGLMDRGGRFLSRRRLTRSLGGRSTQLSLRLLESDSLWLYAGYRVPDRLMRDRRMMEIGSLVGSFPVMAEDLLEVIYGSDWRS
jgi:hypothetical protein